MAFKFSKEEREALVEKLKAPPHNLSDAEIPVRVEREEGRREEELGKGSA